MRSTAIIVLMALTLGAFGFPSFMMVESHDGQPTIMALDVCHASTPALSVNGEMPCVNERPCSHIPNVTIVYAGPFEHIPNQIMFSAQNDRPKKPDIIYKVFPGS